MQIGEDRRQILRRNGAVDEQGLGCTADAGAPHLRVDHDTPSFRQVGGAVHIGMAQTLEMRDDRNAALALNPLDEGAAAARNDHVDEVGHAEHQRDRSAVPRRYQLHRGSGQPGGGDTAPQSGDDDLRGMEALRTTAQDRGVPRSQAESAGIGGHVGARFIDDTDHAKRDADTCDVEPVGARPAGELGSNRIGQFRHRFQAHRDRLDAPRIETQPVEHRRGDRHLLGRSQIFGVCGEEFAPGGAHFGRGIA